MTEHTDRLTDRARRSIDYAMREALQLGHNYIAPEHLILGILREGESTGAKMLHHYDASLTDARTLLIELYSAPARNREQVEGLSQLDVERIADAVARRMKSDD